LLQEGEELTTAVTKQPPVGQQSVASFFSSQGFSPVSCPADFWVRISAMSLGVMADNSSFLKTAAAKTSTFFLLQHVAIIFLGLTETSRGVVRVTTLITDGRRWEKLTALKFLTQCPLVRLVKVDCRQVKALVSEEEGKVMEIGMLEYGAEEIICAFGLNFVI
jgi:hypothetical protein